MEGETVSSNASVTSLDDKTEDFCDNPTCDALAEGLMLLIKPTIDQLDEKVKKIRISQIELKQQIESLADDLKRVRDSTPENEIDLDSYVKKLLNIKHKVTVVSNVLQGSEERLRKLESSIEKDSSKHRALVETEIPTTENPSIQ